MKDKKETKVSEEQMAKIKDLIAQGFVFNGKARVCGHCDSSCTDE